MADSDLTVALVVSDHDPGARKARSCQLGKRRWRVERRNRCAGGDATRSPPRSFHAGSLAFDAKVQTRAAGGLQLRTRRTVCPVPTVQKKRKICAPSPQPVWGSSDQSRWMVCMSLTQEMQTAASG